MNGNWIPTQLVIGGIDTTIYLMRDSLCYPKLQCYTRDGYNKIIEVGPGFDLGSSSFHCAQYGSWEMSTSFLFINMQDDISNIGPFLSKDAISWRINSNTGSTLSLSTNFNGEYCSLNLQKVN